MYIRETFCVFTLFVFCIDYFLVYDDTVINYKFVFTNNRHQSTPANLSYSQCTHFLTVSLCINTLISKIIYSRSFEVFFRHHRFLFLTSSAVSNLRSTSEIQNGRCF